MSNQRFKISEGRSVRWCSVKDRTPRAHAPTILITAFAIEALVLNVVGSAQSAKRTTWITP